MCVCIIVQLFCVGENSCANTTVANVYSVFVDGYNGLSGATIITDTSGLNISGNTTYSAVLAQITGANNYNYSFYCSELNICEIECLSNTSCTNMNLYCFGICLVDCIDDNIDCPRIIHGNFTQLYTQEPSQIPTKFPTNTPNLPSLSPSTIPTHVPLYVTTIKTSGI